MVRNRPHGRALSYELTHGPLYNALSRARSAVTIDPAQIFLSNRTPVFGRGLDQTIPSFVIPANAGMTLCVRALAAFAFCP